MSALRLLFGLWALVAGGFIEFYARRYEFSGAPLLPHGVLAILAVGALLAPYRLAARMRLSREAVRATAVGVVCAAALLFATHRPLQVVHVAVAAGLLALVLAALAAMPSRSASGLVQRAIVAFALATLSFAWLLYYLVLVIGLETWNQIISRELIWTYAWQLPQLISALPISPWIPWSAGAGLFLALVLLFWIAAPAVMRDVRAAVRGVGAWLAQVRTMSLLRRGVLLAVTVYAALLSSWVFEAVALSRSPDPIMRTFFGKAWPRGTTNMPLIADPALDALSRQAAENYVVPERIARKTLVLITVDALRADQMQLYGHSRENTPFLSRMHRDGRLVRYDNAFSACTESHCGLLAILAGRNWHEIGAGRERFGLTEVLKRLGYRNHFLLGGDHTNFYDLRRYYGGAVDQYIDGASARGYINDDFEVAYWLEALDASGVEPRFIYIHLMSVHVLGMRHPQYRVWYRTAAGRNDSGECCPPSHEYVNNYHDGILQTDALIERIFGILRAKGLLQNAIVAITADHGEYLGEEGRLGHGADPLDPVVRVPLLIYDSDGFPYPARALSSVIDIAPTLLERIGAPVPSHWTGVPLTRPAPGRLVLTQGWAAFAVIGEFGGDLLKYYRALGEKDAAKLVRLSAPGVEEEVTSPGQHAHALSQLQDALPRRAPALIPGQ